MSSKNNSLNIAAKTAKLNELVAWFNGEDFELEKAIEKFNEAQKLAGEIESDLLSLKNEISVVSKKFNEES